MPTDKPQSEYRTLILQLKEDLEIKSFTQLAALLGVPYRTLYGWLHLGRVPKNKMAFYRKIKTATRNKARLLPPSSIFNQGLFDEIKPVIQSCFYSKNPGVMQRGLLILASRLEDLLQQNFGNKVAIRLQSHYGCIPAEVSLEAFFTSAPHIKCHFHITHELERPYYSLVSFTLYVHDVPKHKLAGTLNDKNVAKIYRKINNFITLYK